MSAPKLFRAHRQHVRLDLGSRPPPPTAPPAADHPRQRRLTEHLPLYQVAPQKYHATSARAWVELVGHHADPLERRRLRGLLPTSIPRLLDKSGSTRFYRSATLASETRRAAWVEPDFRPFPWHRPAKSIAPSKVVQQQVCTH